MSTPLLVPTFPLAAVIIVFLIQAVTAFFHLHLCLLREGVGIEELHGRTLALAGGYRWLTRPTCCWSFVRLAVLLTCFPPLVVLLSSSCSATVVLLSTSCLLPVVLLFSAWAGTGKGPLILFYVQDVWSVWFLGILSTCKEILLLFFVFGKFNSKIITVVLKLSLNVTRHWTCLNRSPPTKRFQSSSH